MAFQINKHYFPAQYYLTRFYDSDTVILLRADTEYLNKIQVNTSSQRVNLYSLQLMYHTIYCLITIERLRKTYI